MKPTKKPTKKLISLILAFTLLAGFIPALPLTASAVTEVSVLTLTALQTEIANAPTNGTEKIITLASGIAISGDVSLTGAPGSKITVLRGITGNLITVQSGASFTLEGIIIDGNKDGNFANGGGSLVRINANGTFTMNDGTVLRNNSILSGASGGGVNSSGIFTMNGGEISNNTANYGGGVYGGGTLTMIGGEISGNTAYYGGGVYGGSIFTVGDTAKITSNTRINGITNNVEFDETKYIMFSTTAPPAPGMSIGVTKTEDNGVFVQSGATATVAGYFFADEPAKMVALDGGRLKITDWDGLIVRNMVQLAAAITTAPNTTPKEIIIGADFEITSLLTIPTSKNITIKSNGTARALTRGVTGNFLTVSGGASLTLENIIIDGNKALYTNGGGTLVQINPGGSFTMNGSVTLRNNYSGGVINQGIFIMTGGEISGNTASLHGGGVFNAGTFSMTGGEISGNTASLHGGGVYCDTGAFASGGTAKIINNTLTDSTTPNNVEMSDNRYITIPTVIPPAPGMSIGVTKTANDGVFVQNGATAAVAGYFFADDPARMIALDGGSLKIWDGIIHNMAQLAAAIETAPANQTLTTEIIISADFEITSLLTISTGKNITIKSDGTVRILTRGIIGRLFTVSEGASLTFENIIIDGNKDVYNYNTSNYSVLVRIDFGGIFTMNSGTVLRNNSGGSSGGGVDNDGTFTMTGGEIIGNIAAAGNGGGVCNRNFRTFIMTGGKISGNIAREEGGGVRNSNYATFTMTGGEISGNTAGREGGGVFNHYLATFTMTNSKINSNTANSGGGVYSRGTFIMTNGEINGNTANNGGGVLNDTYSSFTTGGIVKITGNTLTNGTTPNNVEMSDNIYIRLSTETPPTPGMNIGVTKTADNGVFVESIATTAITTYFFADDSAKCVKLNGDKLTIQTKCVCEVCICECDNKVCHDCGTCGDCISKPIAMSIIECDGFYVIEIRNTTNNAISTKGMFITDDPANLHEWQMPAVIIRAGEAVLVRGSENNVTPVLKRMTVNWDMSLADSALLSLCLRGDCAVCNDI